MTDDKTTQQNTPDGGADNLVDLTAERRKRARKRRRRRTPVRTALFMLLVLALAAVVGYTVLNRDSMTDNPVRKLLESLNVQFSGDGKPTDLFQFDRDVKPQLALYKGGLAALGPRRLAVYDTSGTERIGRPVAMDDPVLRTSASSLLVFDRGGAELQVYDGFNPRAAVTFRDGILNAKLSAGGGYTVLYREPGYTGVAGVYDSSGKLLYKMKFAGETVLDAALSPDGKRLAAAAVKMNGANMTGEILIYDTANAKGAPVAQYSRPDGLPVAVEYKGSAVASLWDDGLALLDAAAGLTKWFAWPGQVLRSFSLNGDNVVLQVSAFQSDGGSTITVLSPGGKVLGSKSYSQDILSIDAYGGAVALLTPDNCIVTDAKLKQTGVAALRGDVRRVLMRDAKTLVLAGSDTARVETVR